MALLHCPSGSQNRYVLTIACLLLLAGCAPKPQVIKEREQVPITLAETKQKLNAALRATNPLFSAPSHSAVDTIIVSDSLHTVLVRFNANFARMPFRDSTLRVIQTGVRGFLDPKFASYSLTMESDGQLLEQLVPNYFRRDSSDYDRTRMPFPAGQRPLPVVSNLSSKSSPTQGLQARNIVVWPSHGWYYNDDLARWEWQRPRLFQAVEDLIPLSFVVPYLVPMLEHAGANVFLPRERDIQTQEVVVDNDNPSSDRQGAYREDMPKHRRAFISGPTPGFARGTPPYPVNLNPFRQGTWRKVSTDSVVSARVNWIPSIPEDGKYAVYVSYAASDSNADDAAYYVRHRGGVTAFRVNQQIGGGTWIYLGTFEFGAGIHPDSGSVVLTNQSARKGKFVTADAVRFGGGMGNVKRNGTTSGRARYVEAARYYLQYAGIPDTLVYNLSGGKDDYRDDYFSRPEYVNYLMGVPAGPRKNRMAPGLSIPVDLSLAFHTDAGITHNDTTVGTLSIFSVEASDSSKFFPGGMSRMANRDLADIVQTQIVQDLRIQADPAWTRRELRNAKYIEASNPNVPAMLLELLSHQNFLDMKYMLDPQFRFIVARAVYKGILRFLSTQYQTPYAVQPLPVSHMATTFNGNGSIVVTWKPVADSLEPTARPDRYIVYTRLGDGGFDNGTPVNEPRYVLPKPSAGKIYSFRVTAVNDGGESFPSEVLSACHMARAKGSALLVNGFTRVAGPAAVETPQFAGMMNVMDPGVPDQFELSFTGTQYDFDVASLFRTNDSPGHGASHAGQEGNVIAGNTFDFPFVHGKALRENGFSFASCSSSALMDSLADPSGYTVVDLILGQQKRTSWPKHLADSLYGPRFAAFPARLQTALSRYCAAKGHLFVSGAYVGTDLFLTSQPDTVGTTFASQVLRYIWDTDHAAVTGAVASSHAQFMANETFGFNVSGGKHSYNVVAPDAIAPTGGSEQLLRYVENNFPAATGYRGIYGVVAFGFPFETIHGEETRAHVMGAVLRYLLKQ
jgi:hypothetical protein